jgi:hypothetical protein
MAILTPSAFAITVLVYSATRVGPGTDGIFNATLQHWLFTIFLLTLIPNFTCTCKSFSRSYISESQRHSHLVRISLGCGEDLVDTATYKRNG